MNTAEVAKTIDEVNALLEALMGLIPDHTQEQLEARAQIEGNAMAAVAEAAALLGLYDDEA